MRQIIEKRLIEFSLQILKLTKEFNSSFISDHLSKQIIRSSTSAALNYGEVQSSESQKDFIHKISIVLKELRETNINIQLIQGADLCENSDRVENIRKENVELISIFYKTWETAKKNS